MSSDGDASRPEGAGGAGYVFAVWPLNEVRGGFPAILRRFADEGPLSPPVIVGRHRRPEAAVVPYRLLARLLEVYERDRAPQVAAELLAPRADDRPARFAPLTEPPGPTAHRLLADDLDAIAADDPEAADAVRGLVARIGAGARGGHKAEAPGVQVWLDVAGYVVVADRAAAKTRSAIRVLGAVKLPTLYDPGRLASMAALADPDRQARRSHGDKTVPSPAPRTRIVALDQHAAPGVVFDEAPDGRGQRRR